MKFHDRISISIGISKFQKHAIGQKFWNKKRLDDEAKTSQIRNNPTAIRIPRDGTRANRKITNEKTHNSATKTSKQLDLLTLKMKNEKIFKQLRSDIEFSRERSCFRWMSEAIRHEKTRNSELKRISLHFSLWFFLII